MLQPRPWCSCSSVRQLDRSHAALVDAAGGRGRVVFVGGEAGIGKTASSSTSAAVSTQACSLVFGRCDALGTPRASDPSSTRAVARRRTGRRPDALLGDLVAGIRSNGPVLLVVEDAHWADDATIDLIAMLGRRAVDLPLLFVVTYREDEVGAGHPLRQALGNLATTSGATGSGSSRCRSTPFASSPNRGASADDVYALTGGNPFFVTEASPHRRVVVDERAAGGARQGVATVEPGAEVLDAVAIVPGRAEGWLLDGLCERHRWTSTSASLQACCS